MDFGSPAKYFPIQRGTYEVAPGLRPLATDFGNGPVDHHVFQLDSEFNRFRESKLACRKDNLKKYFQIARLPANCEQALIDWMIHQFILEHPTVFSLIRNGQAQHLICHHTKEEIHLDENHQLLNTSTTQVPYISALDALANQVSEDICLTCKDAAGDWLAAAHVCSPGHWSAEQKIGKPFSTIHEPVPGIEPITQKSEQFVDLMIHRGPLVRFAWGFGTDDRLNHHPQPPAGIDPLQWKGRAFDPSNPQFFLRIERQIMWGLPTVNAAVFTIRVFHLFGEHIRADSGQKLQLISALQSMSPASRKYKGLDASIDQVLGWLNRPD